MTPVRWIIVGTLLVALVLIAAACAPAAQPTQEAAPTKAAPADKPAAAAPAADKTAATPVAKSAPKSDWKAEWDKVVAAAKKEGKVAVNGPRGALLREAAMEFQKAYPGIEMDYTGAAGSAAIPKILAERQGDMYLWDVYIAGAGGMLRDLLPNKALDSLRPALILPEVLDDSKWHGGFNAGFLDTERKYVYQFFGYLSFVASVNRKVAPASELSKIDQLVDPKWKGKIAWQDPRRAGSGQRDATTFLVAMGEDWYRKLLSQDIAIYDDPRRMLEEFIRGRYAVTIGNRTDEMEQFKEAGLLDGIEDLDPNSRAGGQITGGSGQIGLMNKAPNPNAAKVFINWVLSKQGQESYAKHTNTNSRRLDVEGPPETAPRPGIDYVNTSDEAQLPLVDRAGAIAKEVLK